MAYPLWPLMVGLCPHKSQTKCIFYNHPRQQPGFELGTCRARQSTLCAV